MSLRDNATFPECLVFRPVDDDKQWFTPKRAYHGAAGLDLFASSPVVIPPLGKHCVDINLMVEIPFGYYGRVAECSGLAYKSHVGVGAGVIDFGYTGPIGVILRNFSNTDQFQVNEGDRVAQLIIEQCKIVEVVLKPSKTSADVEAAPKRGPRGYGSSGSSSSDTVQKLPNK